MRKPNRKCSLCGKEYFYCPSCDDGKEPTWKIMFDNKNCQSIFYVLTQYNFGHMTVEKAKSILSDCDLTIEMKDRDRNTINEIMSTTVESVEIMAAPIVEEVVEPEVEITEEVKNIETVVESVEETVVEENIEETVEGVEEKPTSRYRKRNKK